jgi:hypothetical protein
MATSSFADLIVAPAPPSAGRPPRRRVVIAVAAAAAVLTVLAAVLAVAPGRGTPAAQRVRSADGRFSVVLPDGWRALRASELRTVPTAPAAVLRREDGRGVVVVRRRPALAPSRRSLTRELTAQLTRRFRGVRPVTARTVKLPDGPAYVYTFARPAAHSVQSIAVAPRAGHTYTLDAVTGAGAPDVAAQVGAILRSFDTSNPVPHS